MTLDETTDQTAAQPDAADSRQTRRGRRMWRRRVIVILFALVILGLPSGALTPADAFGMMPIRLCQLAISAAYASHDIPSGLLEAIATVESGRSDGVTGARGPWPWTINAEGQDHFFPDMASAVAAVRDLQAQGVRSIDVGCMQVNLMYHPDAFASLEDAFDPMTNVSYAAGFLARLHDEAADWMRAAAAYHSRTPQIGESYAARVRGALDGEASGQSWAGAADVTGTATAAFDQAPMRGPLAGADIVPLPAPIRFDSDVAIRGAAASVFAAHSVVVSLPRPHRPPPRRPAVATAGVARENVRD